MKITDEEKQKRWVIGVSGGADSMALLSKCVNLHMDIVVAHMNYQKRESASRDMQGVQDFCDMHHISCVIKMQDKPCIGNFQAFARRERYAMYHEVIQEYHAYGVLIAHQLDDHLETYLMQKKRASIPSFYGIKRAIMIYNCHVLRPLLNESKQQLETYCETHHIPYFLDESNLSDDYTRNRIRHTYIDAMSEQEKQCLNEEIMQANRQMASLQRQVNEVFSTWQKDCGTLCELPHPIVDLLLQKWVFSQCHIHISQKECDTIHRLIIQGANKWTRSINETYDISMQYGMLSISKRQQEEFQYTFEQIQYCETPFFQLTNAGKVIEGITLVMEDFPITIRSYKQGDAIKLRLGTKKINRFFIDHKIPLAKRRIWPIVINALGEIIFVPEIGCDISHFSNNPNLFVIK